LCELRRRVLSFEEAAHFLEAAKRELQWQRKLVEAAGIEAGALAREVPMILAFVERAKPARVARRRFVSLGGLESQGGA
jgi:hypothetical protein